MRNERPCEIGRAQVSHCTIRRSWKVRENEHEGDLHVRKHLRGLGSGASSVVGKVVDEEGSARDLSSDVRELGEETENGVLALVERTFIDDTERFLRFGDHFLRDLGKCRKEEQYDDRSTETGYGEVSVLKSTEGIFLTSTVESLGSD